MSACGCLTVLSAMGLPGENGTGMYGMEAVKIGAQDRLISQLLPECPGISGVDAGCTWRPTAGGTGLQQRPSVSHALHVFVGTDRETMSVYWHHFSRDGISSDAPVAMQNGATGATGGPSCR